jgi:WD40 repeat protein
LIASGGADRQVRIWDAASGKVRRKFAAAASRVNAIAFSPDGVLLATGSLDGPVGLWDAAAGKPIGVLRGHTDLVFELVFNEDGTKLISAGQSATLKLWDLTSDAGLRSFPVLDSGPLLENIRLRVAASSPLATRWVGGLAIRPDGAQVASAGTHETLVLWSFASGNIERTIRTPTGSAFALTYNHNGTRLAFAASDRSVRVYDLKGNGEPLVIADFKEGIASVAFSGDGKTIATGGGDPPSVIQKPAGKFSPADSDLRSIRLWDSATGRPQQSLQGHIGSIHAVAFVPGKKKLISAGADGCVRVWNLETAEPVFTMNAESGPLFTLAVSPGGTKVAAGGEDHTIRVWDLATGRLVHTLTGHTNWVMGVAFSPDGTRLASAGADQTVRIWDVERGHELLSLRGPKDRVHGVAFSPDGLSLVAASADGVVRVWESERFSEARSEEMTGIEQR